MPAQNIIIGQHVDPVKVERAKELRSNMTEEEAILWQQLRGNRLNGLHFRRQQVIDGFIVDFYCHAASLVVEVDGGIHAEQADYDVERDCVLAERDLRVLRVTNADVRNDLPGVLGRIREACERT
jgi:very-short-patch-repair endonuclease